MGWLSDGDPKPAHFLYQHFLLQNTGSLVLFIAPFWTTLGNMWRGRPKDHAPGPDITIVALVVRDGDRQLISTVGGRNHWKMHFASTGGEAWTLLNQLKAPIFLCDREVPGAEWRDVIQRMASSAHRCCAILLSSVVDDYLLDEVTHIGGYDVLSTPLRENDVSRVVRLAWSYWNTANLAKK
jgi:hypothetical protein